MNTFKYIKNISWLILVLIFVITTFDVGARNRGGGHGAQRSGGGHRKAKISNNGPSRSGSLNANNSYQHTQNKNRNLQKNINQKDKNQAVNKMQNKDFDNRPNQNGNRHDNWDDNRDDRWDHRDDVRDENRDYREDVRNERREYIEHSEWNDGIVEWDDDNEWGLLVAAGLFTVGTAIAVSSFQSAPCTMTSVNVNGLTYYQCDQYWYQQAYQSGEVVYIVVENPY